MIERAKSLSVRIAAVAALVLAAGCNVSAAGQIPCADDSSCPASYPVCSAGKCVAGAGGSASTIAVSVEAIEGHASTDVVNKTVTIDVVARAASGIAKLQLAAGTKTFDVKASTPPLYTFDVDTTQLTDGAVSLVATVTPGDGSAAKTSDPFTLNVDNRAPSFTAVALGNADARDNTLVTVDVTSDEKLASISGTVFLGATKVGIASEIAAATLSGSGEVRHLGYPVTSDVPAGAYTFSVSARDFAGNAVSASKGFTVRKAFSFSAMTVTGVTQISGLQAGATGSSIAASVSLPTSVDVGTAAPVFKLVDAAGASRTFTGSVTAATSGGTKTWSIADAVGATDASGTAAVTASIADQSGNTATITRPFQVDRVFPQVGAIAVSPAYVETGDTVSISAVASKPLQAASVSVSTGETGTCTCDGGSCAASTSTNPVVNCSVTVTKTVPSLATAVAVANIAVTDKSGNLSSVSSVNQGSYTVVPHPSIVSFTAAAPSITAGGATTLIPVFSDGAGAVFDDQGSSPITIQNGAPLAVSPPVTTKYTLRVTNLASKFVVSSQVTVTVATPPGFSGAFTVTPTVYTVGDTGNMVFTAPAFSPGATGVITGPGIASGSPLPVTSGGTAVLAKSSSASAGTYTYTLTATNAANATNSVSVTVTVVNAPAVASGSFTVSPSTISQNDSGNLTFTAPVFSAAVSNASIQDSNGNTVVSSILSGGVAVIAKPSSTTGTKTYSLILQNGASAQLSPAPTTSVTVVALPTFGAGTVSASPARITAGEPGTITFTAGTFGSSVTSATLTGGGLSTAISSGATATLAKPATTTTYTLTLFNATGTASAVPQTVVVTVIAPPSVASGVFSISPATITQGDSIGNLTFTAPSFGGTTTATATVSGTGISTPLNVFTGSATLARSAMSASTGSVTYTMTAANDAATPATFSEQASVTVVAPPSATGTLTASPGSITAGDSGFISLTAPATFASSVTSSTVSGSDGSGPVNIAAGGTAILGNPSAVAAPAGTTLTYTLKLDNAAGTQTDTSKTAFVTVKAPVSISSGSFTVDVTSLTVGDTGAITFTAPTYATANGALSSLTLAAVGSAPSSGAATIATPGTNNTLVSKADFTTPGTYTYTLTAKNGATTPNTSVQSVTITAVAAAAVSSGSLSVSPNKISVGETGNLVFTAPTFNAAVTSASISTDANMTANTIASGGTMSLPKSDSAAGTVRYFLILKNSLGNTVQTQFVDVTVVDQPSVGSPSTLSSDTTILTVGDTGAITLTAPNFANANGSLASATLTLAGTPSSGSASIANNGSNATYVKKADFVAAGRYTYSVTASNTAITPVTLTKSVTITAYDPPAVAAGALTVSPSSIQVGDTGNLTITAPTFSPSVTSAFISTASSGATSGTPITTGGSVSVAKSTVDAAPGTTSYYLYLQNGAGKIVEAGSPATVTVTAVPGTPSFTGNLTVSPTSLKLGDTTTQLTFSVPATFTNITSSTITGNGLSISGGTTGGATIATWSPANNPQSTTTFTLTGLNSAGATTTRTVTLLVGETIPTGSMAGARYGAAAVYLPVQQKVLVVGGSSTSDAQHPLNTAVVFDPSTGTYGSAIPFANTNETRYRPVAVLLAGGTNAGKVLVSGGAAGSAHNELYDPALGSFSSSGAMATARCGAAAAEVGSGVVVIAGGNDCLSGGDLASAEFWDSSVATNVATAIGHLMTVGRRGLTATVVSGGKTLLAGGNVTTATADVLTFSNSPTTASQYAANATFTSVSTGATLRRFHTATLLTSGKVLIAGGNTTATSDTAELFDPVANSFSQTAGEMASTQARTGAAAVRLPSGLVLIAGGTALSGVLNTTEYYDPSTSRFAAGPAFVTPRDSLFAVWMSNDLTVIGGGTGDNTSTTTTSEMIIVP